MPQHAARRLPTPSQQRPGKQAVEVLRVKRLEHSLQVIMATLWAGYKLTAADLPDQVHLAPDIPPVQIQTVTMGVDPGNGTAKEFAEENMRQGLQDRRRSPLQQVRDADVDSTGLQTDEAVGVREMAKLHGDLWQWSTRFEFPENAREDFFRAFKLQGALKSGNSQTRAVVLHFLTNLT